MGGSSRIIGVVLAAGASVRMGRAKALLVSPDGTGTFVARCVAVLREGGLAEVLVVGRPGDRPLQEEVAGLPGASFVVNDAPERGQLSSLVAGLDAAEAAGAAAVVVMPVDLPLVRPGSVRSLLSAHARRPAVIARVTHRGRHGHPVLFSRAVFDELRLADPAAGARAVLRADPSRVRNVDVDDPGVLRDVDYPADYAALFGDG